MTAAIHMFPVPPAFAARAEAEARREKTVAAARAILRSVDRHDDEALISACLSLQTWGGSTDWLEADVMLQAVRHRAFRKAQDASRRAAQASARRGTIRRALADCAGLALIIALTLAVYHAGP